MDVATVISVSVTSAIAVMNPVVAGEVEGEDRCVAEEAVEDEEGTVLDPIESRLNPIESRQFTCVVRCYVIPYCLYYTRQK